LRELLSCTNPFIKRVHSQWLRKMDGHAATFEDTKAQFAACREAFNAAGLDLD